MAMLPWRIIFRSVNLSVQVFEMENCCGNTLEIRSGASSIAFKVTILFGSLYSTFVSIFIKKNRTSTRTCSESW
jgi:hypothetical protein